MERYDPLIDILKTAEESIPHSSKAAVLRNLRTVLLEDAELSMELGRRVAEVLKRPNDKMPAVS